MPNCHFCNANFVAIQVDSRGGWFCPSDCCGQYNGFNESGDYLLNHREILNYDKKQNGLQSCARRRVASSTTNLPNMPQKIAPNHINTLNGQDWVDSNVLHDVASEVELCSTCQHHEYTKLQILSRYDPPLNASEETIEQFKRSLDKRFPLCNRCQRQNLTLKLPLINQKLRFLHFFKC